MFSWRRFIGTCVFLKYCILVVIVTWRKNNTALGVKLCSCLQLLFWVVFCQNPGKCSHIFCFCSCSLSLERNTNLTRRVIHFLLTNKTYNVVYILLSMKIFRSPLHTHAHAHDHITIFESHYFIVTVNIYSHIRHTFRELLLLSSSNKSTDKNGPNGTLLQALENVVYNQSSQDIFLKCR